MRASAYDAERPHRLGREARNAGSRGFTVTRRFESIGPGEGREAVQFPTTRPPS
jgi:hypothetical protein